MGRVRIDRLTTHRFPFERALEAYDTILKGKQPVLGVVLIYDEKDREGRIEEAEKVRRLECGKKVDRRAGEIGIGLIGAGLFARGTLLPAMKRVKGIRFEGVATLGGLSGKHIADKFRFNYCTTDYRKILEDENISSEESKKKGRAYLLFRIRRFIWRWCRVILRSL